MEKLRTQEMAAGVGPVGDPACLHELKPQSSGVSRIPIGSLRLWGGRDRQVALEETMVDPGRWHMVEVASREGHRIQMKSSTQILPVSLLKRLQGGCGHSLEPARESQNIIVSDSQVMANGHGRWGQIAQVSQVASSLTPWTVRTCCYCLTALLCV